jgi:hypothetical protein
MERLGQVTQTTHSITSIALGIITDGMKSNERRLVIFNPLSFTRDAICRFELPPEYRLGVNVLDEQGQTLPGVFVLDTNSTPLYEFIAKDLPAVG